MNLIKTITGLEYLQNNDKGRMLLYLIAFVPMIYKLISPFFIIAGLGEYSIIIMPTLLFFGITMAWKDIRTNIQSSDWIFYLVIVIFLGLTPILSPDNKEFWEKNYLTFIFQVLSFFFVGALINYQRDEKLLRFVARMGVFVQMFWQTCLLLGLVQSDTSSGDSLGEQMESAYQLLFPIFMLFILLVKQKNLIDFACIILGIFLAFSMGARGPIMVLIFFFAGYLLFFRTYKTYANFKRLLVLMVAGLSYYYLEAVVLFVSPLVASIGFSTRVFDSILESRMADIDDSSYRDDFYGRVFKAIQNDGTGFGHGWGSDRLFTPTGGYAHNLELELFCQFGVIGGSIIFLCLFIYLIKSYKMSVISNTTGFWFVMICSGFMALQFSYTYVQYPIFFVFLGYVMNYKRKLSSLQNN